MTDRRTDREECSARVGEPGLPVSAALLLALLFWSCSESIPSDLQVSNYAGAGRARYWSNVNLPAFDYFNEVEIESLDVGLLGPPLSLGTHDMVALAAGGRLVRIRNNRALWSKQIVDGESFMPQLASDASGSIYLQSVDAELFAVDTGGTLLWRSESVMVAEDDFGLPLYPLALEGSVIVGNTDGKVAGIDVGGKELWSLQFPTKLSRYLASAGEGRIAIGQSHNAGDRIDTLTMISTGGEVLWKSPVDGRIEVGPICFGGRVAVGISSPGEGGKYRPVVALFDADDGDELWRSRLRVLPRNLAFDGDGNLYVTGGGGAQLSGGAVTSFGPGGAKRWEVGLRRNVPSTIFIAGNVYFIAAENRSIGLFSYTREGNFLKYTPVETPLRLALPPTLLPTGKLIIAVRDSPLLLRN